MWESSLSHPFRVHYIWYWFYHIHDAFVATSPVIQWRLSSHQCMTVARNSVCQELHLLPTPRQSSDAARLYNEFKSAKNEQESYNKSRNLFHILDQNRHKRWKETVSKLNFTHSSCEAWQTVKRLSGDSGLGKGSTLSQQTPQHHSW